MFDYCFVCMLEFNFEIRFNLAKFARSFYADRLSCTDLNDEIRLQFFFFLKPVFN